MKAPAKGARLTIHERPLTRDGYSEPATLHGPVKILYQHNGEYFYKAEVKHKDGRTGARVFGEKDIHTAKHKAQAKPLRPYHKAGGK